MGIPAERIRTLNSNSPADGEYVLYWMVANRRSEYNFSLQRAVEWAEKLSKPLVVFEGLQSDYAWASDRFHQFVIQGMSDNAEAFAHYPVSYLSYVEPKHGAARGLIEALIGKSCVTVTDDFPCFFLPAHAERRQ